MTLCQLSAAEFQYNDKKHVVIDYILFELNFGRHPWKENLTVKMELPKLESFLQELQESWEVAKKSMEIEKEAMKKQFDKKRRNQKGLKVRYNVWLKTKNINSN